MVLENSLHDRAQIDRLEVAFVTKVRFFQTGPVGKDAAALYKETISPAYEEQMRKSCASVNRGGDGQT